MKNPLQITYRHMEATPAIEENIREKAAKLDTIYEEIMSCRVAVEAPHRHHHKGKSYVVRIDLTVPGGELVINREPISANSTMAWTSIISTKMKSGRATAALRAFMICWGQ